jgi:hypothetical protein
MGVLPMRLTLTGLLSDWLRGVAASALENDRSAIFVITASNRKLPVQGPLHSIAETITLKRRQTYPSCLLKKTSDIVDGPRARCMQ